MLIGLRTSNLSTSTSVMLWYLQPLGHLIWLVFCRNIYKHNKDTLDWGNHDCDIFNTNSKVRRRERKTFSPVKSIKRIGMYCTWINNNMLVPAVRLREYIEFEILRILQRIERYVNFGLVSAIWKCSNCNCVLDLFNSLVNWIFAIILYLEN